MCIGRASPRDTAREAGSRRTSKQRRKEKPLATPGIGRQTPNDPRRHATSEPRRRPPDPRDVLQGRAPGGRVEPPGPAGGQDEHLQYPRGRNAGPRGRGATENGQARSSRRVRRSCWVSDAQTAAEGRPQLSFFSSPSPPVYHPLPYPPVPLRRLLFTLPSTLTFPDAQRMEKINRVRRRR